MKRKKEEVPGFDEIIFKDRNQEYGAYKLRKNYGSTVGVSLLIAVGLAVVLVVLPSLTAPKGSAQPPNIITIDKVEPEMVDPLKFPDPPKNDPPTDLINLNPFVPPEVVSDTTEIINGLLPNDVLLDQTVNGTPTEITPGTDDGYEIIPPEPKKYIFVAEMPEYPGGEVALLKFIADNVVYPVEALENRVEGKITIRFVVSPTGIVEETEIYGSTGTATDLSLLENEAMRVIRMLPNWRPGKQDGVPVPVYYTVPVTFKIN